MGIYTVLNDIEMMFNNSRIKPIIVNDLQIDTENDREMLLELTRITYDNTDLLNNVPSCSCGELSNKYNLGVICPNCNTPVENLLDKELEPYVWMRAPNGVEKFIHPEILAMLSAKFTKAKINFNIIRYLCDSSYPIPHNYPSEIDELKICGVERGYNNFVSNFYPYMEILFNLKSIRSKRGTSLDSLYQLLLDNKDKLFTRYLPFPNKFLLIVEKTEVGIYVDPIMLPIIDTIKAMTAIDTESKNNFHTVNAINRNIKRNENKTAKALFNIVEFINTFYHDVVSPKSGLARKHMYGTRCHFSCRAVITSMTKPHRYDEIHLPWGVGLNLLTLHLANKLYKLGYTSKQAMALIQNSNYYYNELIDRLFKELIAESSDPKGIPCLINRNPSLTRSNTQCLYITLIKTDIYDYTIGLSILDVRGFNADFDGDQQNINLTLDEVTYAGLRNLEPHRSLISNRDHRKVTDMAAIPKNVISTFANWYSYQENTPVTRDNINFMMSLSGNP